jgi:hypothetical protein
MRYMKSIYIEANTPEEADKLIDAIDLALDDISLAHDEFDQDEIWDKIQEEDELDDTESGKWSSLGPGEAGFSDRPSQIDNMTASDNPEPYYPGE